MPVELVVTPKLFASVVLVGITLPVEIRSSVNSRRRGCANRVWDVVTASVIAAIDQPVAHPDARISPKVIFCGWVIIGSS
jgi:hypothetical protein